MSKLTLPSINMSRTTYQKEVKLGSNKKLGKKHELLYESFNLPLATNILETIKNYFAIFMSSDKKEI